MSTIVFDGDETLWFSLHTYDGAMFEFLHYLHGTALPAHTPVNGDYTYHLYNKRFERMNADAINPDTMEPWGIQRGRVAKSMVDTYQRVCYEIKNTRGIDVYDKKHETHINKIGDKPFEATRHPWAPGAREMLEELIKLGHTVCVLTKYDQDTWRNERAAVLEVAKFFKPENIRAIHGRKTPDDFRRVAGVRANDATDYITVGNSKDDLIMVTEVDDKSWRGFFVAIPTTSPIESESSDIPRLTSAPVKHPRIVTVKKVTDILDHLRP